MNISQLCHEPARAVNKALSRFTAPISLILLLFTTPGILYAQLSGRKLASFADPFIGTGALGSGLSGSTYPGQRFPTAISSKEEFLNLRWVLSQIKTGERKRCRIKAYGSHYKNAFENKDKDDK